MFSARVGTCKIFVPVFSTNSGKVAGWYATLPVPDGPAMAYLKALAQNDSDGSKFTTGMVGTMDHGRAKSYPV